MTRWDRADPAYAGESLVLETGYVHFVGCQPDIEATLADELAHDR